MLVFHDSEWQFPAITEQHAFRQARLYLPDSPDVLYVAFPWATLFDRMERSPSTSTELLARLQSWRRDLPEGQYRVTVCQHIHLYKHKQHLVDLGITDVFWSHATKDNQVIPGTSIRVWPFPLYPVHKIEDASVHRKAYLFSFVGATSNQWYLTDTRKQLDRLIGDHKAGLIKLREKWHFNKVVYDHQVENKVSASDVLVDNEADVEYKEFLRSSHFALCPAGTGPNSIRLWECVESGIIPVILADTYLPPGNRELWEQGAVFCSENSEEIRRLPERLASIAKDQKCLQSMQASLEQIRLLYGADCFVYDLIEFFLNPSHFTGSSRLGITSRVNSSNIDSFLPEGSLPEKLLCPVGRREGGLLLQSLLTRLMIDPVLVKEWLEKYPKNLNLVVRLILDADTEERAFALRVCSVFGLVSIVSKTEEFQRV